MLDFKISIGLVIADLMLYLSGILFWFSLNFAHSLGVVGFFPRFFAGLVSLTVGIIITIIIIKS
jgi:hypothetical protein